MEIRDHENQPFIPTHFLTVYSRDGHAHGDKYLEIGDIMKDGNTYKIGTSVPADKDFLNDLAATIKVENFKALRFKGLIPENVWYYHSEDAEPTIVWFRKKESRQLFFDKKMGMETGMYKMPNLLFVTHKDELFVFRVDVANKDIDANLFMVPLPNIYDESRVCLGNNKLKKAKTMEEYIANMEELFYKTRFNALHHEGFGKDVVVVDVMRSKDLNKFPFVKAEQITLKKLLNEIS